jgi:hypothetical protein
MATPQNMSPGPEIPFIGVVKAKHGSVQSDYGDDYFRPMTMEEFNAKIDRSLEDIRAGRTVPHEEVFKKYAQWL